ncbi:sugar-transfer associated ATP-grasp domain-containing protein [Myroides sp. LJL115]
MKKYQVYITKKAYKNNYNQIAVNVKGTTASLTKTEKSQYIEKWKIIDTNVDIDTVSICKALSGKFDVNIVPDYLYNTFFEPKLNNRREVYFLEVKNNYNRWFKGDYFPKLYLNKIGGSFYTMEGMEVIDSNDYLLKHDLVFPLVCKPSLDTYGGAGVQFVNNYEELDSAISVSDNLVIQEKIVQHEAINQISSSINTVRVCLLKLPRNSEEVVVLNSSLRMGVDGGLDNESGNGIVCRLDSKGNFNNFALNKKGIKFETHPNTSFLFEGASLPYYKEMADVAIAITKQIPFANVVSLDMCLDNNSNWRCIEVNLFGQSIRFSQYAGYGFFGEYTDEVIANCLNDSTC